MQENSELTGLVISRCRELEVLMRRAGATGSGMRELSESLAEELDGEILKLLRYIGTVRNQFAHQLPEDEETKFDLELFQSSCSEVEAALAKLLPQELSDPVAELQNQAEKWFHRAAYVPFLHVAYPLRLFYASLRPGAGLALALLFALLAIMPLPAVNEERTYLYYLSGVFYLLSYFYGIWHAVRPTLSTAPRALAGIPVVSLIYICWSLVDVIKWRIFPGSLLLILLCALPYWMIGRQPYWLIGIIFAFGYIACAVTASRCQVLEAED